MAKYLDLDGLDRFYQKIKEKFAPLSYFWKDSNGTHVSSTSNSGTIVNNHLTINESSIELGHGVEASGDHAVSVGYRTVSSGSYSYSEGYESEASGNYGSHAEGRSTEAVGASSHAEGDGTISNGAASHAQNKGTTAQKQAQTVLGTYNELDSSTTTLHPSGQSAYGNYAVIVGNGTSNSARNNALTVSWDGQVDMGAYLHIDSDNFDMKSSTNGASVNFWPSMQVRDVNDLRSSLIGTQVYSTGVIGTGIWAYNYNSSGTQVGSGSFLVNVDKSGNVTYGFSKQPMREAAGVHAYGSLTEMSSTVTLTTTWQKLPLSSSKFIGSGCSVSSNGLKVSKAGTYEIYGSMYIGTGYTAKDIVHLGIYKTTGSTATQMHDWRRRAYDANPYEVFNAGPIILTLAANDVIDLRAYNQGGARGSVNSLAGVGLYIRQIN